MILMISRSRAAGPGGSSLSITSSHQNHNISERRRLAPEAPGEKFSRGHDKNFVRKFSPGLLQLSLEHRSDTVESRLNGKKQI